MASIRPDFQYKRGGPPYRSSGASKRERLSGEIPIWVVWCLVGVLFLIAVYLSPDINPRHQLPQTATTLRIEVIDGDTVRYNGNTFRLVGFNTPESFLNAQCSSERALASKATDRLQQLLEGGVADLQRVACACEPGTEGSRQCNYGRLSLGYPWTAKMWLQSWLLKAWQNDSYVGQHRAPSAGTGVISVIRSS